MPRLMIETVVHRYNAHQLEEIFALAADIGAYRYIIHNLRYIRSSLRNRNEMVLSIDELSDLQARAFTLREKGIIQVQPPYLPVPSYLRLLAEPTPGVFGCGGLVYKIGVKADGSVFPCLLFEGEEYRLGDVRESSLRDIWNAAGTRHLAGAMHPPKPDRCHGCPAEDGCGAGCPAAALAQGAGLGGVDNACPVGIPAE